MTVEVQYPGRASLMSALAEKVAEELQVALDAAGRATLAVPGGTTPAPFFEILRKAPLDWSKVIVLLTDERFVPESSDRSNTRLLKEALLRDKAAAASLVPFYQIADQPEDVLDHIRAGLDAALPIDVCVLGMGVDMHTASLFPGADLLEEALSMTAPIILPMRAPGAPEPRLTLTAPALLGARKIHVLITGEEKKHALALAMSDLDAIADAPVRLILRDGAEVTVHYAD
ncbi:6-phosphogluconolactonase [Coralliovum pocilloporae]|uniref:6-phosphogluconolactonase n=1 Tax=Coralliovum pocilloporae TaxID=3066369 RepID=UPI003306A988